MMTWGVAIEILKDGVSALDGLDILKTSIARSTSRLGKERSIYGGNDI